MKASSALGEPIPGISPEIYSSADFGEVAQIIYAAAGIVLPAGKAMLVYSRLAPLVRDTACITFSKYIERIRSDKKELARAVAALTTNHTFFYREAHHFEHLARTVRPSVLRKLKDGQPVRLWSAGCSSGEETWSMVMTLLGPDRNAGLQMTRGDLRILASDISPGPVERAQKATYPAKDMKPVPDDLVRAWTRPCGEDLAMSDPARSIVRFRMLNLLGEWPIRGKFDAIFCRNVMIYFDGPTKEKLVLRFAQALLPGAYLFIGHSERVTGPAGDMLELVGPTIYRRSAA